MLPAIKISAKKRHNTAIWQKDASGGDYLVEFGEFYGGVVDLTNPEAYAWFKEVIKRT